VGERIREGDMVAGSCENFGEGRFNHLILNRGLSAEALLFMRDCSFHQPAVWFLRQHLLICGGLQRDLHYCFDWDVLIRYLYRYPKVVYITDTIAKFRLHTESKTVSRQSGFAEERLEIVRRLAGNREVSGIHVECDRYIRLHEWWAELETPRLQSPSIGCAWRIVCAAVKDPSVRWSRLTAGAVRRAIWCDERR
jgi:hypothetical protein